MPHLNTSIDQPPPLETLDTQALRLRLAGLCEPESSGDTSKNSIALLANCFAAELPRLFGEELERLTMWNRIASGLESAAAKTPDGDCERFVQYVLDHIKAKTSTAVCSLDLSMVLCSLAELSSADRKAFIGRFTKYLIPTLVTARALYKNEKRLKQEQSK